MKHLRYLAFVVVLLLMAAGCTGTSASPSQTPVPTPKPNVVGPVPPTTAGAVPTPIIAKVKEITQAKPVAPNPGGGPRLAIDAEMVDYGDVPFTSIVAYSFDLKNVGTEPISLGPAFIRVKEGC